MKRAFRLGAILNVTHDRLVTQMDDVYDICNFLTNDNLYTHQLPRVHGECKAWLLQLHPQLNALPRVTDEEAERLGPGWWTGWLAKQIAQYGESLDVEPIPAGIHEYKNPIAEACEMAGSDRVIALGVDPEDHQ